MKKSDGLLDEDVFYDCRDNMHCDEFALDLEFMHLQ